MRLSAVIAIRSAFWSPLSEPLTSGFCTSTPGSLMTATTISTAIAGSRRGGPEGSAWADLLGHALQAAPVVLPPRLVPGRHVVVAIPQPDGPVDEFPDDIGVPRVPVSLGDHVDQDPVQRHLAPVARPPRHVADRVQRQRADRRVRMGPGAVVEPDDLLTRLVGGRPHVRVGLSP